MSCKRHNTATPMSELPANLTPVREAHVFDQARLADYMKANVEGFRAPLKILQFEGGQSNPTFHLTDGGSRMYVLRKKPPGKLLPSAHQVDREYRVIKALSDHTDVPVPKPYALCQDDGVIGTAFYIMEFLPGRIFADHRMQGVSPADRGQIFDSMNDVLARLHNVDYRKIGLGDYGREGQYIQRQVARWSSQYDLARTEHIEAMERLIAWLPAHVPPGDEVALIHGDYRPGNVLLHPTEPRLVAVVDWELSTLGHPLVDLAHHALLYHTGPEDLGAFGDSAPPEGIPDVSTYLDLYCAHAGRIACLRCASVYVIFRSSKNCRRSGMPYFSIAMRSIPSPQAKPWYSLGSMPQLRSTLGCTMPQPKISSQSSPSPKRISPPLREH